MQRIHIRKEEERDYRQVEEVTREAFWNLHVPGCDEHYLVHVMRNHPDFIPELSFVAVADNAVVGNIMSTRSRLVNDAGAALNTLTFGPLSVLPEYQKQGIGSALIQHTITHASQRGFGLIVIQGYPHDYCRHGFVGSRSCQISDADARFPFSLLVLELDSDVLQGHAWRFHHSSVFDLDEKAVIDFDKKFPHKQKGFQPSQQEFSIASNAFVD